MFGLSFGLVVEGLVAVLLLLTIGYCILLNTRLKRLHADRDTLRDMVRDLVQATTLANSAIQELKATAVEADLTLKTRLDEAERFGIELASHVHAGQTVMDKIIQITNFARQHPSISPETRGNKAKSALQHLAARARARGEAA